MSKASQLPLQRLPFLGRFLLDLIPFVQERLGREHGDEANEDEDADAGLDRITVAPLFLDALEFPRMDVRCRVPPRQCSSSTSSDSYGPREVGSKPHTKDQKRRDEEV